MKTLLAGLLALVAISLVPPASADGTDVTMCSLASCCPSLGGGGGVVGATIDYSSDMAGIACQAAKDEVAIAATATVATCDATMDYLFGGGCTTTCTCDPQPIDPVCCISTLATDATTADASSTDASAIVIDWSCSAPPPSSGGVVGDTREYALTLTYIGCGAAGGTAFVALGATVDGCNRTGEYLFGSEMCNRVAL